MGSRFINVGVGEAEVPVTTSAITAGRASTETGDVAGPTTRATTERPMVPHHTLGIRVAITRQAMKQAGAAPEAAIRRDLAGTMRVETDRAAFPGAGARGQPLGGVQGAAT